MNQLTAKTLLLGNNRTAGRIAENLQLAGVALAVATPDERLHPAFRAHESNAGGQPLELWTESKLVDCRGSDGGFQVRMAGNGKKFSYHAASIIVCENHRRLAAFGDYGLQASPHIVSLSAVTMASDEIPSDIRHVAFLMGLAKESHPMIAREVMESALRFQRSGKQVYLLTGNLKVAAPGLERLAREIRHAGGVTVKFTDTRPDIRVMPDQKAVILFTDDITDQSFRLSPDLMVVDETIAPSDYLKELIQILQLESDSSGFAQADNVRRLTVGTNRKGILVAGPARGVLSPEDCAIDADNAVLSALALRREHAASPLVYAEIDTGNCVRCLTCHRLCPHHAVKVGNRVRVEAEACEACGICAAECPREAIQLKGFDAPDLLASVGSIAVPASGTPFTPTLAAICCSRSAMAAGELAARMGHRLPEGLKILEVPCAGSVSLRHLLAVFQGRVDGVLVLTCHDGNCHSEKGSRMAADRVALLQDMFEKMGFDQNRLAIRSLAANMGTEFAAIIYGFEKQLTELGPSRLKQ